MTRFIVLILPLVKHKRVFHFMFYSLHCMFYRYQITLSVFKTLSHSFIFKPTPFKSIANRLEHFKSDVAQKKLKHRDICFWNWVLTVLDGFNKPLQMSKAYQGTLSLKGHSSSSKLVPTFSPSLSLSLQSLTLATMPLSFSYVEWRSQFPWETWGVWPPGSLFETLLGKRWESTVSLNLGMSPEHSPNKSGPEKTCACGVGLPLRAPLFNSATKLDIHLMLSRELGCFFHYFIFYL